MSAPTKHLHLNTQLLVRSLALCWIITKLLCYKLWFANRLFPLVPIHDSLLEIPNTVHILFFSITLVSLLALLIFPGKKWLAIVIIISEILSCLLDQNRWKPWEYQFLFMLLPIIFYNDEKKIKLNWQLIVAGLYFFSGLSKFNHGFVTQVWKEMILHQWLGVSTFNPWFIRLGWLLPLIEMAAGIALFFNKSRKAAVIILCVMHLFLLLLLGPLGTHFKDAVILPWNILMPILLIHLFYKSEFDLQQLKQKHLLAWVTILFWWILPWLNLIGYWDNYFSSVLYSGKTQHLYICTSNINSKSIFQKDIVRTSIPSPCDSMISVFQWSQNEINVAPNSELRVIRSIVRQWESKYDSAGADRFFIYHPKFSAEKWVELR